MARCRASYGTRRPKPIAAGTIRETPEGWCVQTSALSRWFGIGVKPLTSGSVLVLQSDEQAAGRAGDGAAAARGAHSHGELRPCKSCRRCAIPYRMWRAPALDFVVSGGVTYRANDGVQVDRQSSVYAAGEIAHLSYDAQVTTTSNGQAEPAAGSRLPLGSRTGNCSARSRRRISASATSKDSTAD